MYLLKECAEKLTNISQRREYSKPLEAECAQKLETLREKGYVIFDHLVGTREFLRLSDHVRSLFEIELKFRTPCLSQKLIDQELHKNLIHKNFKAPLEDLRAGGLLFESTDVKTYDQVIRDYAPSTLTLDIPSQKQFFDVWLDSRVIEVISGYMGFVPIMREAFIRRNFPCNYTVMNHKWHRDTNHRSHLLKAFVFFTDCDLETGAHHYVPSSINDPRFRDGKYYEDDEIDDAFPPEEGKQMTSNVPAGTIILEDTRGLHKAGIPVHSYRDLGFSVFVPNSFLHYDSPHYSVDLRTYGDLTDFQQQFIPKRNTV